MQQITAYTNMDLKSKRGSIAAYEFLLAFGKVMFPTVQISLVRESVSIVILLRKRLAIFPVDHNYVPSHSILKCDEGMCGKGRHSNARTKSLSDDYSYPLTLNYSAVTCL